MAVEPDKMWDMVWTGYCGPSPIRQDQVAVREAWKRDESVSSPVYGRIGRLMIEPDLFGDAWNELKERSDEVVLTSHGFSISESMEPETDFDSQPSAFLLEFLKVCGGHFMLAVRADLQAMGIIGPAKLFTPFQKMSAGPYEFDSDSDGWHRDNDTLGGLTYTMTVAGPTTEFATGAYRNSQFGGASNEMFEGDEPLPQQIRAAHPFDIMVHDQALTLHRAPGEEHNGETRIFSQIRLNPMLDYPDMA
jgi:hypothetical protein